MHNSNFCSNFAPDMKKLMGYRLRIMGYGVMAMLMFASCNKPSRVEQHKAEKHVQDSIKLAEQERSLAFYQAQLEALMPTADSLLPLFNYEINEKYQDHGYYVVRNEKLKIKNYELRVRVRDDGRDLLVYKEGKRLPDERVNELKLKGNEAVERAEHLQITIRDIKELEKRIARTSLEVQKYQKRLQRN